jgi:exodeoxyribonuclease V gamma subunit
MPASVPVPAIVFVLATHFVRRAVRVLARRVAVRAGDGILLRCAPGGTSGNEPPPEKRHAAEPPNDRDHSPASATPSAAAKEAGSPELAAMLAFGRMLVLHYSNRSEELADALADAIATAHDAGVSPLEPTCVLVPNRNVERFLVLALARRSGVAANLSFSRLERFVAERARSCEPPFRLLDAATLEGALVALLLDETRLAHAELEPVRAYLHAAGDDDDAVDLRRVELARRLARLFEEYSFSRPELLASFRAGRAEPTLAGSGFEATERWQRRLWLSLVGGGGLLAAVAESRGERLATFAELVDALAPPLPRALHVFGFSYLGAVFHRLFDKLARATELHVYAQNPCAEFWEDLRTTREARRARFPKRSVRQATLSFAEEPDPFGLKDEENALLRAWGRPGREHMRLLNELSQCDYDARFKDPLEDGRAGARTLLRHVQHDILFRHARGAGDAPSGPSGDAGSAGGRVPADGTLRIVKALGLRRELEIVADAIWSLLSADDAQSAAGREPLRMSDIAVVVAGPDRDRYLAQLPSVFAECRDLPFSMIDVPVAGSGRLAEALDLFLGLPTSRFARSEVLELVTHPAIFGRCSSADPEAWVALVERLGVAHGASHDDHAGTYIDEDVFNWDQALRRIALGALMPSGDLVDDGHRCFEHDGRRYVPEELPSAGGDATTELALLVRSLLEDARFARGAKMPLAAWASFFGAFAAAYLAGSASRDVTGAADGQPSYESEYFRVLSAIEELRRLDVGSVPVRFAVARDLLRARLRDLGTSRGYRGVVVSSLVPMRAIPFRWVFVLGLGEGGFPSTALADPLDLRAACVRPGDVNAWEQDTYLFLETLLSARDGLVLSYIARDEKTGEPRGPSSVLRELLRVLEREYVGKDGITALVDEHPLRRFDRRYFPDVYAGDGALARSVHPSARREAQANALRQTVQKAIGARDGLPLPPPEELERLLPPSSVRALREMLVLPSRMHAGVTGEEVSRVTVSLAAIRRFLESPLEGSVRHHLGLRDEDTGEARFVEDEPFATDRLAKTNLLRDAFERVWLDGLAVPAAYEQALAARRARGLAPLGPFLRVERKNDEEILANWRSTLEEASFGGASFQRYAFGKPPLRSEGRRRAEAVVALPPIAIDVTVPRGDRLVSVKVELTGQTERVLGERASLRLGASSFPSEATARHALPGYVDALALSAAGITQERAHETVALDREGKCRRYPVAARSQAAAVGTLRSLLSELLARVHDYFLPIDLVATAPQWSDASAYAAVVGKLRAASEKAAQRRNGGGVLRESWAYPELPFEEARRAVESRFVDVSLEAKRGASAEGVREPDEVDSARVTGASTNTKGGRGPGKASRDKKARGSANEGGTP